MEYGLDDYQVNLVKDMVMADFECGHPMTFEEAREGMLDDDDLADVADDAAQFYVDCVEMGPAGFFDENRDLDWDPDYAASYSNQDEILDEPEEGDFIDESVKLPMKNQTKLNEDAGEGDFIEEDDYEMTDESPEFEGQTFDEFSDGAILDDEQDYEGSEDAINGLMILLDKGSIDGLVCVDNEGDLYTIFDENDGETYTYDMANDCLIDDQDLTIQDEQSLTESWYDDLPDDDFTVENKQLFSTSDLARLDADYMGDEYKHYFKDYDCRLSEWAKAGLMWCEDKHKNGNYFEDDEDYQDALNHYNNFSVYDILPTDDGVDWPGVDWLPDSSNLSEMVDNRTNIGFSSQDDGKTIDDLRREGRQFVDNYELFDTASEAVKEYVKEHDPSVTISNVYPFGGNNRPVDGKVKVVCYWNGACHIYEYDVDSHEVNDTVR